MNRNGNETESFAGNFVASDEQGLFFEVPSNRLLLTVWFRPRVQNYSVTRLWLILADPMALAIRRFLGSSSGASGGACVGNRGGRPPLVSLAEINV